MENLIQLTEYDEKEYQKDYREKVIEEYYANHNLRSIDLERDLNIKDENLDEYYKSTYTDAINSLKDLVNNCKEFMELTRLLFVIRLIKHGTYTDFIECIINSFWHIPREYEEETSEERIQFIYGLYHCTGRTIKIASSNMNREKKEKLIKLCLEPIKTLMQLREKEKRNLYISIEDWQKILFKLGFPGIYLFLKKHIDDVEKSVLTEWEEYLRKIQDILRYIDKGLLVDNFVLSKINFLLNKK